MNICAKNCKHYEYCIPFRYNNLRKPYMTAVEVDKTKDDISVIYVKRCAKYERSNGFYRRKEVRDESEGYP